MNATALARLPIRRPTPLAFVPYETLDRPLCELCGPATRKRAVFFDATRHRPLCAMCAVERFKQREANRAWRIARRARGGRP